MDHRRSVHPDGPNPAAEIVITVLLEVERVRQSVHPGPMITALAVDENTGLPDDRWFAMAQELGRMAPGEDRKAFWVRELDACRDIGMVLDCGEPECKACRFLRDHREGK